MAKVIALSGVSFNNPDLPRALYEPFLTAGSIALIDPTHPLNPWAPGVPADGYQVPNLAADSLKALMPASTDQQIHGEINNVFNLSGRFERSSKGGLHGIIKHKAADALESNGIFLQTVREYIAANPTHDLFHSFYGRVTRKDASTSPNNASTMAGVISTTGEYMNIRPASDGGLSSAPSSSRTNTSTAGSNAIGDFRVAASHKNLTGTPSTSNLLLRWTNGHQQNGQVVNASWILYHYYVEDLTVSGRTFSQVSSLVTESYTQEVLTPGGRYYGDTYTNPTTVV